MRMRIRMRMMRGNVRMDHMRQVHHMAEGCVVGEHTNTRRSAEILPHLGLRVEFSVDLV